MVKWSVSAPETMWKNYVDYTCGLDAIPWAGPPVKLAGAVRSPRNISVDVEVCTKGYDRGA